MSWDGTGRTGAGQRVGQCWAFMSHPIDSILSMSPRAKVGIIFRRGIDASHLSPLLTARGIAHKLSTMEGGVTPKASVLAKIRTVAHHISHVQTMSDVLRGIPAAGLPVLSLLTQ